MRFLSGKKHLFGSFFFPDTYRTIKDHVVLALSNMQLCHGHRHTSGDTLKITQCGALGDCLCGKVNMVFKLVFVLFLIWPRETTFCFQD